MRIALLMTQAPFVSGGAEFLANNLKNALIKSGHEAEIVSIPFMDSPLYLIENHIVAARLFDMSNSWAGKVDLAIGLKFPAYYIPHPNKVIWALHQHRAAYDLFNTDYSNIKDTVEGREIRNIIYAADNKYLREAKRVYTIAGNVSKRMQRYNHISSTPLYHPCPDMEKFYCDQYEDYILMPSRMNITKRQMLALEALSQTKGDYKIYFVGKADNVIERNKLTDFVKEHHLQNRVRFFDFVSQEEKIKLYANARAVLFVPLDEDYGYITLEAMAASKAVITAKDSGGPLEFVLDNKTGIVADSAPQSLAEALDFFGESKEASIQYGKESKKHLEEMNITWDNVVKELTR